VVDDVEARLALGPVHRVTSRTGRSAVVPERAHRREQLRGSIRSTSTRATRPSRLPPREAFATRSKAASITSELLVDDGVAVAAMRSCSFMMPSMTISAARAAECRVHGMILSMPGSAA